MEDFDVAAVRRSEQILKRALEKYTQESTAKQQGQQQQQQQQQK
jgi:hypothetical protein